MEVLLNAASVPAIAAIVYFVIEVIKYTVNKNEKFMRLIPAVSAGLGIMVAVAAYFIYPAIIPTQNIGVAIILGAASGLTATGFNQIIKQSTKKD